MSVVCATCKTENRANAMFCRGCAAKLPGFAATGPSALESMKPLQPRMQASRPGAARPACCRSRRAPSGSALQCCRW